MPELPEVETVIRSLFRIKDKLIENIEVIKEDLLKSVTKGDFVSQVCGQTIRRVERKGKYIFIFLDNLVIINHLRMTGKYFFNDEYSSKTTVSHLALVFHFGDKTKAFFYDARNFATFHLQKISDYKGLYPYKNIGLDLINDDINIDYLFSSFQTKKGPIKATLLEQNVVSGIGNIYASEILFLLNIHPLTTTSSLSMEKTKELLSVTKKILQRAIELKGSSIVDFVGPDGEKGSFQNELKVYDRENRQCYICFEKIIKISIDNRSTFFCPNCQALRL